MTRLDDLGAAADDAWADLGALPYGPDATAAEMATWCRQRAAARTAMVAAWSAMLDEQLVPEAVVLALAVARGEQRAVAADGLEQAERWEARAAAEQTAGTSS